MHQHGFIHFLGGNLSIIWDFFRTNFLKLISSKVRSLKYGIFHYLTSDLRFFVTNLIILIQMRVYFCLVLQFFFLFFLGKPTFHSNAKVMGSA